MSQFDFDSRFGRGGTGAIKWTRYGADDTDEMLPFWVADMDFKLAPAIQEALQTRLDHGFFGYSEPMQSLDEAFIAWIEAQYGWRVHADSLVWIPGVVPGFNLACKALEAPDASIMMNTPIYYPFLKTPEHMGHRPIYVPLSQGPARAEIDFDRMRASLEKDTRMFLACNPQNPTGRVYSRDELTALAEFCIEHDLFICSDEIHSPLVLDAGLRHQTIAEVVPEIESRLIALFSPSKAWNFAGLGCGVAVIPDATLRSRFRAAHNGLVPMMSPMSMTAAEAAYRHGEPWRMELLDYLRGNHQLLQASVNQLAGIHMHAVEGTYLAWIDVSSLRIDSPAHWLRSFGIALSEGAQFKGPDYVRFNFACARSMLQEGIDRFETGIRAAIERSHQP